MYQLRRSKIDVQDAFSNQMSNKEETLESIEKPQEVSLVLPSEKLIEEPSSEEVIKESSPESTLPPPEEEEVIQEPSPEPTPLPEEESKKVIQEPSPEPTPLPPPKEPSPEEVIKESSPEPTPLPEEEESKEIIQESSPEPTLPLPEEPSPEVIKEPSTEPTPLPEEPSPEEVIQEPSPEPTPLTEEPSPEEVIKEPSPDQPTPLPEEEEEPEAEPTEVLEDVPLILYDYAEESYYLDNAHFLERKFDSIPDGTHTVNLCIYTCVRNGCMPYLLYLTVYDKLTGTLVFPSTTNSLEIIETDSDEDVQTKLMDVFKDTLFDIYPPNESKPMDMENEEPTDLYNPHLFRGFFRTKDTNSLLMVYDATRINVPVNDNKEYFWTSPYEILILNQMRNLKIDPTLTNLFKTIAVSGGFIDQSFYRLRRESDKSLVPSPYILFPCSRISSSGFNLFGASSTLENIPQENEIDLLVPTVSHPQIGNFPLFSALPLDPNIPPFKRFVAFVDIDEREPFFVEEGNTDLLDHLYDMKNEKQYSSLCFFEKGVQYWVVKSPIYFTEIHDDLQKNISISSFREITGPVLAKKTNEEDSLVLSNEDGDEISNEGYEVGSNEDGDEASNEGSDTASNESSDDESQSDESQPDEYKRGYDEGYQEALLKQ